MRIIGGKAGGRIIKAPDNLPVRPTTDRAKESLFNIFVNRFDFTSLSVLDLFSGTGNIAFEFASRGAYRVVSIDANPDCVKFIRQTAKALQFDQLETHRQDVFKFLRDNGESFDLVFADPPYALGQMAELPVLIIKNQVLNPGGSFVLEHGIQLELSQIPGWREERRYGQSAFAFFS